ncbi:MAG: diguanylate cyclase [Gammaproteobacteria bacterium]|nr:diguanylate cyclase [Gammaproteobacteria bacterium]
MFDASDGEEAWEMLCDHPAIELVITDINMPRLTGQQLLVRIRKSDNARIRQLPVIVMTTAEDNVDRNLAFLNGANDFINKPIDEMELLARTRVHHTLASTIRELEQSRARLAELATTDPLTRLNNRRSFFEQAEQHLVMAERYQTGLAIVLLDIDFFKKINDSHGHHSGDAVLVAMAGLVTDKIRSVDTVARMGGEEFALLLPGANRLGAAVMAERIRAAVEQHPFAAPDRVLRVTASLGIASLDVDQAQNTEELLAIADRRLYLAKNNGRNRICVNDQGKSNFQG